MDKRVTIYQIVIVTDYYLLFGTNEIGLTIARRLEEGHGVVATDLRPCVTCRTGSLTNGSHRPRS